MLFLSDMFKRLICLVSLTDFMDTVEKLLFVCIYVLFSECIAEYLDLSKTCTILSVNSSSLRIIPG